MMQSKVVRKHARSLQEFSENEKANTLSNQKSRNNNRDSNKVHTHIHTHNIPSLEQPKSICLPTSVQREIPSSNSSITNNNTSDLLGQKARAKMQRSQLILEQIRGQKKMFRESVDRNTASGQMDVVEEMNKKIYEWDRKEETVRSGIVEMLMREDQLEDD